MKASVGLAGVLLLPLQPAAQAQSATVTVNANQLLNPTGILASPLGRFAIAASGVVDLSAGNGGYQTDADGRIAVTPPAGSGAFSFFRSFAAPVGADPVAGTQKLLTASTPGPLVGAPFGALVGGFAAIPNPSSLADFAQGFALVGAAGTITAPSAGGYLFLTVNDWDVAYGDNAGALTVRITPEVTPEPATVALLGGGLVAVLGVARRRRRRAIAG